MTNVPNPGRKAGGSNGPDTGGHPLPAAIEVALRATPGLDVAQGMRVTRGRLDRYLHLLGRFLATHGESLASARELLEHGDFEALRTRAHAVRGAAASLGVERVAGWAGRIEQATMESPVAADVLGWAAAIDAEIRALAATVASLGNGESAGVAPGEPTGAEAAGAQRALADLGRLVAACDTRALVVAAEHHDTLARVLGARCALFLERVNGFEFRAAAAILHDARLGYDEAAEAPHPPRTEDRA